MGRSTWAALLAVALAAGCGGAQEGADGPDGAGSETAAARPRALSDQEPSLRELTPLAAGASLEERTERASQLADRLRVRSDRVQRWLREARRAEYVRRTACLDDLLSQLHAAEREGVQASQAVHAAASQRDERIVDRELSRLYVFEERSRMLVHMARACGQAKSRSLGSHTWLDHPALDLEPVRSASPANVAQR